MFYSTRYESPVGVLTLASNGTALCGLWLEGQKYHGASIPEAMEHCSTAEPFEQTRTWLDAYFAGKAPSPHELPLAPLGSAFRQAVWEQLLAIPYGELTTYGVIAKTLSDQQGGKNVAAIAVGGAVGHNPISIIIPCHRVVGSNGTLTGYAGGLDRKRTLLELEGIDASKLAAPKKGVDLRQRPKTNTLFVL